MTSMRTRLLAGTVMAIVLSAPLALALGPGLILTNFQGTLHISQGVPCGAVIEGTTSIAGGRMDITPIVVRGDAHGAAQFNLTRLRCSSRRSLRASSATASRDRRLPRDWRPARQPRHVHGPGDRRAPLQLHDSEGAVPDLRIGPQQPAGAAARDGCPAAEWRTSRRDRPGPGTAELHIAVASRLRFRVGAPATAAPSTKNSTAGTPRTCRRSSTRQARTRMATALRISTTTARSCRTQSVAGPTR